MSFFHNYFVHKRLTLENTKKKVPLALLIAIQPLIDEYQSLYNVIVDSNLLMHLLDSDAEADFYFKISKQEVQQGKLNYLVEHKPQNGQNTDAHAEWVLLDNISAILSNWLKILDSYNKVQTIYDDPITKANQERFGSQFEILDSDADFVSLDLTQQLFLFNYLESVKSQIAFFMVNSSKPNETLSLAALANEVDSVQADLTSSTKNQIMNRLTFIWAKAQKIGLPLIKEIFINVASELTSKLITGQ